MCVCLAFPPYLAWIEQRRSFSTEGKKKKRNTAGGEVELSKRQIHPSHDQPQTFAAVTLVICALTVGNMAGQLPLGQMTFHFSVMAAFRVLSLSRLSQFFSLLPLFKDVSERWAADSVCRCSSERGWLACPGCTPPPSRMSSGTGSSLPWSLARCTKCACQYSQVEEITSIGSSSACFFLLLLNNFEHMKKQTLYDSS